MAFQKFAKMHRETDWGKRQADKRKSQWRKRQRNSKHNRKLDALAFV